jgi:hypothetical protein
MKIAHLLTLDSTYAGQSSGEPQFDFDPHHRTSFALLLTFAAMISPDLPLPFDFPLVDVSGFPVLPKSLDHLTI